MMIDEEKQEWENIKEQINKKFDEVGKKLDKIKDVIIPNQKMTVVSEKEIKALRERLDIAVKALEFYANENHFDDYGMSGKNSVWFEGSVETGVKAQEALARIKEIK